jgi:hypothetical protein
VEILFPNHASIHIILSFIWLPRKQVEHQIAMKRFIRFITICSLLGSLMCSGCVRTWENIIPDETATLTPRLTPAVTPLPLLTAMPSHTPVIPDSGWRQLRPGLERRVFNLISESGEHIESLYLLRVEPAYYQFGIAYHAEPQSLDEWQEETNALIILNGGYFRVEEDGSYIPTGLTVVEGEVMGVSYESFAGMLAVTNDGPELRWLAQKPYDPDEPLLGAVQSFPLLVKPGGEIGFPEEHEDNMQARRTVIAQDRGGRILMIIASKGYFTLHQLSAYLTASDLDLDIAINLDGGPSSGVLLAEPIEEVSPLTLLPIVITIHPRDP